MTQRLRGSTAATAAGALGVAGVLGSRSPVTATTSQRRCAPRRCWVLLAATALQLVALLSRCEAWYTCVSAAGGVISRRRLFHAGGLGNLGSLSTRRSARPRGSGSCGGPGATRCRTSPR